MGYESRRREKREESKPQHFGVFNIDGSWAQRDNENEYLFAQSGTVNELVRRLTAQRRGHGVTPRDAAILIEASGVGSACPMREQWLEYSDLWQWPAVPTHTSAEETIKCVVHHNRNEAIRLSCMSRTDSGTMYWPDNGKPADPAMVKKWVEGLPAWMEAQERNKPVDLDIRLQELRSQAEHLTGVSYDPSNEMPSGAADVDDPAPVEVESEESEETWNY